MSGVDIAEDLALAGLSQWKGSVHADPMGTGRKIAVVTSPNFDPIKRTGRMITRYGRDQAEAIARAVEASGLPEDQRVSG